MLETFKDSASKKQGSSTIDTATIRKRKVLISSDTTAQKFISVDFSATNDKLLVTLGDDNSVVVWQFDKVKCLAFETMQLPKDSIPRQVSFNNQGSQLSIVVVGRDVYKFFTLSETNALKCTH
jgi:hypothetical protein